MRRPPLRRSRRALPSRASWIKINDTPSLGLTRVGMAWRLVVALVVGFAVFFVLAPTSGAASRCFSSPLGFEVPCSGELAIGAGAAAAVLVGTALLWAWHRQPN